MQREEKIWLMCLKKNNTDATLGVVGESRNDDIHHHTRPQHSINGARHGPSPARQRAPLPRDEQRRLLPDSRVQFYVSPYARTRSMLLEFRQCFLKKRIIGVREESWVRERDSENFHVEERMKVIKETREHFGRFFYQEENFNFSPFRRKLKFCTFSCLKFCFKFFVKKYQNNEL